jgi:hypothetical protein
MPTLFDHKTENKPDNNYTLLLVTTAPKQPSDYYFMLSNNQADIENLKKPGSELHIMQEIAIGHLHKPYPTLNDSRFHSLTNFKEPSSTDIEALTKQIKYVCNEQVLDVVDRESVKRRGPG